ncbi:MAG: hypothetical protein TEF_16885 [Rhizobiales bacterium NRL2]|jgi:hypothetical protein|nr:MAG: hypothetical protein TEF_16885 [Rhizobiales bacterium NRL2]
MKWRALVGGDMKFELAEGNALFLAAWIGWRKAGAPPRRRDVRLEDIVELLPGIILLEARAPDVFHFRLAGTGVDEYSGMHMTGVNALDLTAPENRATRARRLWSLASTPCGGYFRFLHRYPETRAEAPMEGIILPVLADADDAPVQLMSVFSSSRSRAESEPPSNDMRNALPDEFYFVDLGFGAPEGEEPVIGLDSLRTV